MERGKACLAGSSVYVLHELKRVLERTGKNTGKDEEEKQGGHENEKKLITLGFTSTGWDIGYPIPSIGYSTYVFRGNLYASINVSEC